MIKIHERFRPYSHRPGTSVLVPGTKYIVTAYPTLIEVTLEGQKIASKMIPGTYDTFLVSQNLEQGFVVIHSAKEKHYVDAQGQILDAKPLPRSHQERLFLGCNKAQNYDKVRERADLEEVLPLWHKLAGYYAGTHSITDPLAEYLSYFSASFVPRSADSEHQGFHLPNLKDPFEILNQKSIRSHFIDEDHEKIIVKKTSFISGRLIHAEFSSGTIHYEWTKSFPRQLYFDGDISKLEIAFPSEVKSYRVTTTEKGLLFDRFEA